MAAPSYDEAELDAITSKEPLEQPYLRAFNDAPGIFSQQWKQTSIVGVPKIEDEGHRTQLAKVLIASCRAIRLDPYNPSTWLDRASHFIRMGYDELAVSDAYKARLLVDSFLGFLDTNTVLLYFDNDSLPCKVGAALARTAKKSDTEFAAKRELGMSMAKELQHGAFLFMVVALTSVRAYHDANRVLDEMTMVCGTSESILGLRLRGIVLSRDLEQSFQAQQSSPEYIQTMMKRGVVDRVAYPWINPEELRRGNKAVKKAKIMFGAVSSNATLGPSSVDGTTGDSLGVFARQNITQGDVIMTDESGLTVLNAQGTPNCWACSEPLGHKVISTDCCKARFCTESCKSEAMKTYHRVLCGKDFNWLYEASENADLLSNDMIPLLLMKVLATAVQQNARPLKVACVGALKADYHKELLSIFKLHDNVVAPVRILQTLGVDIFKDTRFDSWAIQTLILRVQNNLNEKKWDGMIFSAIRPLFCMFNHDCDPSAIWESLHPGGPVVVVADRDIKEGEEITVSYKADLPSREEDRREMLRVQIGTMCRCARCNRERERAAFNT